VGLRFVGVRLDDELVAKLKELAGSLNISFSELIRGLIDRGLEVMVQDVDGEGRRLLCNMLLKRYCKDLQGLVRLQTELLKSGSFLGKSLPRDMNRLECYLMGIDSPEEWEALTRLMSERERKSRLIAELINRYFPEPTHVLIRDSSSLSPKLVEIEMTADGRFKCPCCSFIAHSRREIVKHVFERHR